MNFEVRPIRKETNAEAEASAKEVWYKRIWQWMLDTFGVGKLVLVFILLCVSVGIIAVGIIAAGAQTGGERERRNLFQGLETDDNGNTNLVLLGVGGALEEGGYLTDSIMLVSIDRKTPAVSMVSIPRDTWVRSEVGNKKINSVYAVALARYDEERALKIVQSALEDFTGTKVHYGAVVDFSLFEKVIDEMGGVELYVSEPINDPFYPGENYGYERFVIRAGRQTLDGETALKYARSRQTTSDYNRARRQQDLAIALKERAQALNLFTDFGKLRRMVELYQSHVNTNIAIDDMISLAKVGVALERDDIFHSVLSDDPHEPGGLLYPGDKRLYGGQFVLIPRDEQDLAQFFNLTFTQTPLLLERVQIEILNGTNIEGLASKTQKRLEQMGLHVWRVGNFELAEGETAPLGNILQVRSRRESELTLDFLESLFHAEVMAPEFIQEAGDVTDIRLILGGGEKSESEEEVEADVQSE